MNVRIAALTFVSFAFSILSTIAVAQHGYLGIFEAGFRDTASMQVFFDLSIALTLFAGWMILDARERGATVWPFLVALPAIGSFAPLGYLLMREWGSHGRSPEPTRS